MENILHFKIMGTLGAGGMGVVYKAVDTKLNRSVAIKALGKHISHNPDFRKRFLIEAQAAAALNHPNIATIYDTIEKDDEVYIVMEFIEGEELGKKIAPGNLTMIQTLDYAIQIAEGLKEAHSKGIVHRDIKSANIMVTDSDRIKIMDFGLAKRSGSSMITQLGTTVGTINFMSPEQARGDEIDNRTDLWALGILLYEMVTGKLPFKGDYEQAVIYSILNEEPNAASSFIRDLPKEMDQMIFKLLKKLPEERYQNADELLHDLKAVKQSIETGIPVEMIKSKVSVADYIIQSKTQIDVNPKKIKHIPLITSALVVILTGLLFIFKGAEVLNFFGIELIPSVKHIAVLSFENIGNDPEDKAFADGLLETITSKLSQCEQFEGKLWVVPSSEIRRRKITEVSEAVSKYAVNLAISGSVQKKDNGYRVTINLIDGNTNRQIASRMIDDPMTSASFLQDEAIIKVVEMLNIELKPEMKKLLTAGRTSNPEAFSLYTKGRGYFANSDIPENVIISSNFFEKAIQKDSLFALAYSGLAETDLWRYKKTRDVSWIGKAVDISGRALKLDENLVPARITLGNIYTETGKSEEANREFQKVLEIDPVNIAAFIGRATALSKLGKQNEAEALYKKVIEIKPDYWNGYNWLGTFYYRQAKYKEALEQYLHVITITPNSAIGYRNSGGIYVFLNNIPKAIEMYKKSLEIEPDFRTYSNLAAIYFKEGYNKAAARMYEKVVEINNSDYRIWGYLAASYYWTPDERDKSIEANRRAISLAEAQLKINAKDTELLRNLASFYGMMGNLSKTNMLLKQLEKSDILNVETFFRIGVIYEQWLNNREKSLEFIKKALMKGFPLKEIYQFPGLKNLVEDEKLKNIVKELKLD